MTRNLDLRKKIVYHLAVFIILLPNIGYTEVFYSLSRFFAGIKKDNSFEDFASFHQRFFLESSYKPTSALNFLFSGNIDLSYFYGGFSRYEFSMNLHELYLSYFMEHIKLSFGRKIINWGNVENSPVDIVNRPDFSEGFFNEPRFSKVPGVLLDFVWMGENSSLNLIYEPFFTPPKFLDTGSNWALLSWSSLYSSFEGDKDNSQLRLLVDRQIAPVVKAYPSKLSDVLKSFGLGGNFYTRLDNLSLSFVAYSGFSIFPLPFFDDVFLSDFARTPGRLSSKFDISSAEILEPLSRGEPFVKLEPKRYYVGGGGWSYDISGYLLKSDIAFYLLADFPDNNLRVKEFNLFSFAFDIEREVIPNLFVIPSFRGFFNLSSGEILLIEKGTFLPSLSFRYEFYVGNSSFNLLGSSVLDIPVKSKDLRSYFILGSLGYRPIDLLEVSINGYIFGGEEISLFGFFKKNSAISLWFRISL